jgi:hypothetical protein
MAEGSQPPLDKECVVPSDEVQRDLGAHSAKIDRLERDVSTILERVEYIQTTLDQTKGSVRTLIAIGSISGAIGAGLVKGFAWLKGMPS